MGAPSGSNDAILERLARIEERLDAHAREHKIIDRSLDLARTTMEHRLEGMNEFRAQISNAEAKYLPRSEWAAEAKSIEIKQGLRDDLVDKRLQANERFVWMVSGALAVINALLYFLRK